MRREISLPKLRAQAAIAPGTLNEDARTVEAIFYSGAAVQRYPIFDDPYELSFSMEPKAVRLDRFNSGAPLVDNHNDHLPLSQAVIGVVEKAWLAEDGGHAVVKIAADRPDILARIKDGILRNFSMGAVLHQVKDITEKGDAQKRLLAIDWEPHELSIVPVPADPGAQALAQAERFPCKLLTGATIASMENIMKFKVRVIASDEIKEIDELEFDEKLHSKDLEKTKLARSPSEERVAVDEALEADKKRTAEIRRLQAHFNMDDMWSQRHIKANHMIEQVIADATEQRAKQAPIIDPSISLGAEHESLPWRKEQMAISIAAQGGGREVPETARQFARYGFVDAALEVLKFHRMAGGLDCRRDASRIVELALTTSDYPNMLANAANKMLRPAYEAQEPTYRKLAERIDLPDFKTASVIKVGDFPEPLQVAESGEVKIGYFAEAKDSFALATYARIISISFQALANDDLSGFQRVMNGVASRFADKENSLWFASLISASGAGPTLGDGGALFNATAVTTAGGHANLTASGTAISVDSIGVGRASMRKQTSVGTTGLGDGLKLNLTPRYILTSPDKETLARQYTTALGPNLAASSQNPWAGMLEPLTDANLISANPWYLFADPMRPGGSVSVYGYMSGQSGPQVMTQEGFNVLGVQMRAVEHFGFAFVDHRGAYRNAGA